MNGCFSGFMRVLDDKEQVSSLCHCNVSQLCLEFSTSSSALLFSLLTSVYAEAVARLIVCPFTKDCRSCHSLC